MKIREEWRPVKGNEGLYEISNLGNYRSLDRYVRNKYGKRLVKGHIITGRIKDGYRFVSTKEKEKGVHILVAQAFPEICGEWFEGCQVHHKDGNPENNKAENLIVLSVSEHHHLHYETQPDSFKKASEKRSKAISEALTGRRAYESHIPIIQLTKDGEIVKQWDCMLDIQKELGYSAGNICCACKGKLKTAYGFLWRYAVSN